MLDVQIWGIDAMGHHLTNLLLHAANTVMLFLVLRRLTGCMWRAPSSPRCSLCIRFTSNRRVGGGAQGCPLDALPVAGHLDLRELGRAPSLSRYLVVAVLFALGLLAKPMLVTLPLILLMLDWWPLGRFSQLRVVVDQPPRARAESAARRPFSRARHPASSIWLSLVKEKLWLFCDGGGVVRSDIRRPERGWAHSRGQPLSASGAHRQRAGGVHRLHPQMFWPAGLTAMYPHPAVGCRSGRSSRRWLC